MYGKSDIKNKVMQGFIKVNSDKIHIYAFHYICCGIAMLLKHVHTHKFIFGI
jgi:hypothetical protein